MSVKCSPNNTFRGRLRSTTPFSWSNLRTTTKRRGIVEEGGDTNDSSIREGSKDCRRTTWEWEHVVWRARPQSGARRYCILGLGIMDGSGQVKLRRTEAKGKRSTFEMNRYLHLHLTQSHPTLRRGHLLHALTQLSPFPSPTPHHSFQPT